MKTTDFIDDDIVLYDDAKKIPLPKEPRRTTFIFVGLCTAGTASYTIDTENVVVRKNDIVRLLQNSCSLIKFILWIANQGSWFLKIMRQC